MHPYLERILQTKQVIGPDAELHVLESAISQEEGLFLREIIRHIRPKASLEVGLAQGISAMFICDALKEVGCSKHIVIDPGQLEKAPHDDWQGLGLYNLQQCGFREMIDFHNGPSEIVLPKLVAQGERIDFAFVDGWHTLDQVVVDFYYINRLLNIGGVVAFDDANWPSIRKALRYFSQYPGYRVLGAVQVDDEQKSSLSKCLFKIVVSAVPQRLGRHLFREELLIADDTRGIQGTCVAIQKMQEDQRTWTWFADF